MEVNLENNIYLSVLDQLLDIRYTKSIREEKGGTYGVSCGGSLSTLPSEPDFMLMIGFDTKPEMADELRDMLLPEIERLAAEGPTEEEMGKIKEYMVKQRADNLKQNGSWKQWITNYHLMGVDYTTDYDAIIGSLSAEKVKAIAAKVLESGNVLKLIMDPAVAE
ncbi:MAG: insulinase family protein [Tidjanibacter sp.]|nr:insulinase family protein [Tidjanibacter sp.]